MDKRTIGAFVLIGLIFLIWSFFFAPKPTPPENVPANDTTLVEGRTNGVDSNGTATNQIDSNGTTQVPARTFDSASPYATYMGGDDSYTTIETPLYTAVLNSRGARLFRFTLKKYKTWYGVPVQLINDSAGFGGELGLMLNGSGSEINTNDFNFELSGEQNITLGENDSIVVIARLASSAATDSIPAAGDSTGAPAPAKNDLNIEKRYVFYGNRYNVNLSVQVPQTTGYDIEWTGGLKYQEHNSVDESGKAQAYIMVDDELESFNADIDEPGKAVTRTGNVEWIGTKTKYFATALIPFKPIQTKGTVSGTVAHADSNGLVEAYNFDLAIPAGNAVQNFTLFLGPLEYDLARDNHLTGMVDYGFLEVIVRPISEHVLLPILRFIHSLISNWGIAIIVFSLIIRGLLWPLSIPQIRSSEKMRLVQPVISDIREKYKDDQQKQQMETMKVYREYGVNPAGGCLPLLLQLPILYALWNTIANAIDLRQADFAFWIHDLSIPDSVVHLPFSIPLLGNQLSGLALIMGATLFVQQRLMITDPKQKAMIYFMPIFMTIAFNYFPAGLNLYYLSYNLLSIAQHFYMRKINKSSLTLELLKEQAKGKKKGWLSTKMEEAQKMAEMQGRVPPGSSNQNRNKK